MTALAVSAFVTATICSLVVSGVALLALAAALRRVRRLERKLANLQQRHDDLKTESRGQAWDMHHLRQWVNGNLGKVRTSIQRTDAASTDRDAKIWNAISKWLN